MTIRPVRPDRRPAPRGRVFAIILLVLAALCLIVAIVGGLFSRNSFAGLTAAAKQVAQRFESGEGFATVVCPGEGTLESKGGALVFVAASSDEVDGKQYTYPPSGGVNVSVTDESGNRVDFNPVQGAQPIDTAKGQIYILGFAESSGAGTYTITTTGGESAIRAFSMPTQEVEAFVKGAVGLIGGGAGLLCGGIGFLLFGIIGGVMLLFGRKPTPAA